MKNSMEISGKTRICAIIGDPVEHSMSPAMHNAAFKKLGLDYIYVPFRVKPGELAAAVSGLRALNVVGFNVTIPHKVAILPLLDKLDPAAERIGAVNTVVNDSGKLIGFNTDADGFLRALTDRGIEPAGKKIAIIGAGGASRAVSYILAANGAVLTIFNRQKNLNHAELIASMITMNIGVNAKVLALDDLADGLKNTDILVNTTSVGMEPQDVDTPVPAGLLKGLPVVVDIVYNPRETQLLKDAKKAGVKTIGGVEMLAWQGALSFEKWTGQKAPLDLMRREALKMLEKREN
jgi:shikimate dehydrogenase